MLKLEGEDNMVDLKKISIGGYLGYLQLTGQRKKLAVSTAAALLESKITNYQELEDALNNGSLKATATEEVIEFLQDELNRIKKLAATTEGLSIYEFKTLEAAKLDQKAIYLVNGVCKGSDLPIFNPVSGQNAGVDSLRNLSIAEIKAHLGQIIERYDKNILVNAIGIHATGRKDQRVADIAQAVKVFDSMVIEQSKVVKGCPPHIDLFNFGLDERKRIVRGELTKIVEALIATEQTFLWGKPLSQSQKSLLSKSLTNPQFGNGAIIMNNIVELSARYITLADENIPAALIKRLTR